jgi:hypothetical protein
MPLLMTDVAAGSDAALRLQQNMAAMPNVQQAQDMAMQDAQLKIQQEQENVQKTRLSNLQSDTGIKADADIKNKVQALIKNKDYIESSPSDQVLKLASLYGEAGKTEDMAKLIKSSGDIATKEIANKQKTLDLHSQEVGNAFAVVDALKTPEQRESFFKEMQEKKPEQYKAMVDQIGSNTFAKMSSEEKQAALKGLMLNAKGQLLAQLKQQDLERSLELQRLKNEQADRNNFTKLQSRAMGFDDESKSFNSATAQIEKIEIRAERSPERKALVEAKNTADRKSAARFFSSSRNDSDEYIKAKNALDEYDLKIAKEKLRIATSHKSYKGQDDDIESFKKEVQLFGGDVDTPPPAAKDKPAGTPAPTTSGAPADEPSKTTGTGTATSPLSMPQSKDQLVDGSYYQTAKGTLIWNKASSTFIEPKVTKEDTTKYTRSKGVRGNWEYTRSTRGMTKAEYAELDKKKKE